MNNIDSQYLHIVEKIVKCGNIKSDRTGVGTKSVFGETIEYTFYDSFPILTIKRMHWSSIVHELLWFLRGDTNIKYLIENKCNIWNGDAYKRYINDTDISNTNHLVWSPGVNNQLVRHFNKTEFLKHLKSDEDFLQKYGELGPIYGKQWRDWDGHDQIASIITELINNPDSRRIIVNAWNVGDLNKMVLQPCHYVYQFYTHEMTLKERISWYFNTHKPNRDVFEDFDLLPDEKKHNYLDKIFVPQRYISLLWNQRSVDVGLGLPFNISSYALLLNIVAKIVNMVPYQLKGMLGDTHIYTNHLNNITKLHERKSFTLPKLKINTYNWVKYDDNLKNISDVILSMKSEDFILENYNSDETLDLPLNN